MKALQVEVKKAVSTVWKNIKKESPTTCNTLKKANIKKVSSSIPRTICYYRVWTFMMVILATVGLGLFPYYMAFLNTSASLAKVDLSICIIFGIDSFIGLFVSNKGPMKSWILCSIFDILSVLPANPFQKLFKSKVVYIVFILFRLWYLKKIVVCFTGMKKKPRRFIWVRCIQLLCACLLNVHVGGCIFYLIASLHPKPQLSWTKTTENFFELKVWKRYVTSTYFAMTTFSTVGYGDFSAKSHIEMITLIIYMLWNMGFAVVAFQHLSNLLLDGDKNSLSTWDKVLLKLYQTQNLRKSKKMTQDVISELEENLAANPNKNYVLWCLGNALTLQAVGYLRQDANEEPSNEVYRELFEMAAKDSDAVNKLYNKVKNLGSQDLEVHLPHCPDTSGHLVSANCIRELLIGNEWHTSHLQVWCTYLLSICNEKNKSDVYGFMDPSRLSFNTHEEKEEVIRYIKKKLRDEHKECYLAPYTDRTHFQLIVISPKNNTVVVFCSFHGALNYDMKELVTSAFEDHQNAKGITERPIWLYPKTRRQYNRTDYGYYVMKYMLDIVSDNITESWMEVEVFRNKKSLSVHELYDLRIRWATFFLQLYEFVAS